MKWSGKVSLRRHHTLSPWRRGEVICADTGGELFGTCRRPRAEAQLFSTHLTSCGLPKGGTTLLERSEDAERSLRRNTLPTKKPGPSLESSFFSCPHIFSADVNPSCYTERLIVFV